MLRVLWRDSAPAGGEGDTGRGRRALVYTLAAAIRGHGAGADLLARPDVSRELSSYPAVMAPEERAQQTALYDIVAYGTARRGEGAAAVRTMLADLQTAAGDSDAVYRLIALADRTEAALSPPDLAALDARLRAMPVASADGRITMARLYARSGDAADAQALLEAAFYQLLYPAGPLDAAETLTAQRSGWSTRWRCCRTSRRGNGPMRHWKRSSRRAGVGPAAAIFHPCRRSARRRWLRSDRVGNRGNGGGDAAAYDGLAQIDVRADGPADVAVPRLGPLCLRHPADRNLPITTERPPAQATEERLRSLLHAFMVPNATIPAARRISTPIR